ncbi:MAG TPA: ParB N-terminal domain-containing protein [Thermoplasmata archaeon]|nr:ParB N-terminal domain-containing protein [Thermoplasmata archaeon]
MYRAKSLTRVTPSPRFGLVEIERLHGHEKIRPSLLADLTDRIRKDGVLKRPVLVAARALVILDGHHRVEALRNLGCKRVPAYLVDYESKIVRLTTWPDAAVKVVTKPEVIRRGLAGDRFPPKTTRHTLAVPIEDRPVKLDDLR